MSLQAHLPAVDPDALLARARSRQARHDTHAEAGHGIGHGIGHGTKHGVAKAKGQSQAPDEMPIPEDIRKAAERFESLMVHEMLKSMAKTVPDSADAGPGQKVFKGMLYEELAKATAGAGALGLSDTIARQMMGDKASGAYLGGGGDSAVYQQLGDGNWIRPVDESGDHEPTGLQLFGAHRDGERPDECGDGHCGVDLAHSVGTEVKAASDGVIKAIGRDADSKAGIWVSIAHRGGKIATRYLHLDRVRDDLKPGDHVRTGESIGAVGNTGTSSRGSHLHFEIYSASGDGQRQYIDPGPVLGSWP